MGPSPGVVPDLGDTNRLTAEPRRQNVLVLDGGGVRGLSSLLILQALMTQVNLAVTQLGAPCGELHPYDVFQLVAGTSTGGLIALMLGKIGLTVDECITKYEDLSKVVFGKKHWRGRMSLGLANARYSGKGLRNEVRNLLHERGLDEDLSMRYDADKVACAVVCREHGSPSQYSTLKKTAVLICSLPCNNNLICKVCDAARATSAAPTYFPVMKIENRFFADGGLQHNNPSFAIYFHYTSDNRKKSTRSKPLAAPHFSPHENFDSSCVRFINIGTGARPDDVLPGKRDRLAGLIPGTIRRAVFLKQTLTEIAVNSEEKVEVMRQFEHLNPEVFKYERFDANHGVSNIKLDRYDALNEIRQSTKLYLNEQETKDSLEEVGNAIAKDYFENSSTYDQNNQSAHLVVDQSRHPQQDNSISIPASSSISTPQSTYSDIPDTGPQVVHPRHDSATNNGTGIVTNGVANTFLSPGHPEPARENAGIGTLESGNPMAAASA